MKKRIFYITIISFFLNLNIKAQLKLDCEKTEDIEVTYIRGSLPKEPEFIGSPTVINQSTNSIIYIQQNQLLDFDSYFKIVSRFGNSFNPSSSGRLPLVIETLDPEAPVGTYKFDLSNYFTGSSDRCGEFITIHVVEPKAQITNLNCEGRKVTGTLKEGVEVLESSKVSFSVPYEGGNGGVYEAQTINSTGVIGLTASLAAGTLTSGTGNLIYEITGKPLSNGTASFAISLGGQSCTVEILVESSGIPFNSSNETMWASRSTKNIIPLSDGGFVIGTLKTNTPKAVIRRFDAKGILQKKWELTGSGTHSKSINLNLVEEGKIHVAFNYGDTNRNDQDAQSNHYYEAIIDIESDNIASPNRLYPNTLYETDVLYLNGKKYEIRSTATSNGREAYLYINGVKQSTDFTVNNPSQRTMTTEPFMILLDNGNILVQLTIQDVKKKYAEWVGWIQTNYWETRSYVLNSFGNIIKEVKITGNTGGDLTRGKGVQNPMLQKLPNGDIALVTHGIDVANNSSKKAYISFLDSNINKIGDTKNLTSYFTDISMTTVGDKVITGYTNSSGIPYVKVERYNGNGSLSVLKNQLVKNSKSSDVQVEKLSDGRLIVSWMNGSNNITDTQNGDQSLEFKIFTVGANGTLTESK